MDDMELPASIKTVNLFQEKVKSAEWLMLVFKPNNNIQICEKSSKTLRQKLRDILTLPEGLRLEADDVLGRRPRRCRYVCRFLLSSTSTGFTLWSTGSIAPAAALQARN